MARPPTPLTQPPPVTNPAAGSYTTTYVAAARVAIPPSSSRTVAVTEYSPAAVYAWLRLPLVVPSPQVTLLVCVSAIPGSVKLTPMVTSSPVRTGAAGTTTPVMVGGAFSTVTAALAVSAAPCGSVAITVAV